MHSALEGHVNQESVSAQLAFVRVEIQGQCSGLEGLVVRDYQ